MGIFRFTSTARGLFILILPLVFVFGCSDSGIPQASNDVAGDSFNSSTPAKMNVKNPPSENPKEKEPDETPSPQPAKKPDNNPPPHSPPAKPNNENQRRVQQTRRIQTPEVPPAKTVIPVSKGGSTLNNTRTSRTQTINRLTAAPVTFSNPNNRVIAKPLTLPTATFVDSKPGNETPTPTPADYPVDDLSGIRRLTDDEMAKRLGNHLKDLKSYLLQNNKQIKVGNRTVQLNDEVAFFVDMKVSSGFFRFFVIDLKSNEILERGRVAHGIGSGKGSIPTVFSNVSESKQTSLGKYIVSEGYTGEWGWSYNLDGLESTNNKARDRRIVLHRPAYYLKNDQRFFQDTFHSDGCPMVASDFFETLEDKYIKPSREEGKSILLYIYY